MDLNTLLHRIVSSIPQPSDAAAAALHEDVDLAVPPTAPPADAPAVVDTTKAPAA